ncbi:PREDICTED: protein FAM63A-like, partial [Priapulus caudatus]|uniref:Ubiquitin carboxyl-terminal hydrolase n=1 Tax=Priapulus caudatus TaxID=37621 RepID=A0ABM1F3R0_PRICU
MEENGSSAAGASTAAAPPSSSTTTTSECSSASNNDGADTQRGVGDGSTDDDYNSSHATTDKTMTNKDIGDLITTATVAATTVAATTVAGATISTATVAVDARTLNITESERESEPDSESKVSNSAAASAVSPTDGGATAKSASVDSGMGASASTASSTPSGGGGGSGGPSPHRVKWIAWGGARAPVVTQNENGPCPLIAVMNVLALKSRVKLPPATVAVTTAELMQHVGNCILEQVPKNISEGAQLNYEQNMHDAIAVLPKLQTGLDVNVKFTGVRDFEYTPECIIFDLLDIPLYHGWLVDPQSPDTLSAVGTHSYNQLVEKIIRSKPSGHAEEVTEGLLAEQFLERSASQLTYHGLCELIVALKEEELAVFFRNNHFSTLYKHKDELFLLVTDQGFLGEANVVWETLSNVEGDGHFVDAQLLTCPAAATTTFASQPAVVDEAQQVDQDYLVALSLQEEQNVAGRKIAEWEEYKANLGLQPEISDRELARRLQEEENAMATAAAAAAQAGDTASSQQQQQQQ